jgi:predicted DNA-binding transcriptional regulator AlpA
MWMTYEEVLEEVGVSRSTMDKWRLTGRAPRFKKLPNGQLRLKRPDFEQWLESLPEAA